jgi:outer membrane protein assembly factor BamB
MNKIIYYIIGVSVLLSGLGLASLSASDGKNKNDMMPSPESFPDISAYRYAIAMFSSEQPTTDQILETPILQTRNGDYPIGTVIWQYQITGGYDTSPKAIAALDDINDDGIDDVVICSEDNYIRCFSGGAIGAGVVLWEHEIYSGNIYSQHGLTITEDIDGDGYNDIVVGATGGARLIQCISGKNGEAIWTHDTHEYGDGGWVYQVNCTYDYNNDGVVDVLAVTGNDYPGSSTGPIRVYCLNALTGTSIWECPLGGPGFAVIGVEDFTGDGMPDVVAGCSNLYETTGYAKGINGATGGQAWSFQTPGSSVWAAEQIDDATGDEIPDVVVGDFSGHIYGVNAATGSQIYSYNLGGGAIITRFERLNDVNGDSHPDIIPAHSTLAVTQVIDGYTGSLIWSHSVADQPWNVAPIGDITGDDINDVLVGTLYSSNYVYFLNGVDGSELKKIAYGEAVDAIASIPDVIGDGSMEMLAGGRNGKVVCYSGGENATQHPVNITAQFSAAPLGGIAPLLVQFTDLSTVENTTITSWAWDFENDGTIDSHDQNPSWTYTEPRTYTVSLMVSDGHISDTEVKEGYITVLPMGSTIVEIGNITGGLLAVTAEVRNNGSTDVSLLNWTMSIDGGLVFLGKIKSGTVDSLSAGTSTEITDRPVFGFGRIIVTVTVEVPGYEPVEKTATGFLFLFIVLGMK